MADIFDVRKIQVVEIANDPRARSKIVVFCGHPCAGKTTVLEEFAKSAPGIWVREMDSIRLAKFPGELNDWPKRNAAYRILHFELSNKLNELRRNQKQELLVVSATYVPQHARTELAAITQRFSADLYVVQCVCDPNEAIRRFNFRNALSATKAHAGSDLSVTGVKRSAESYQRFDGAMTIDTTAPIRAYDVLARIATYLAASDPVHPIEWACHPYSGTNSSSPEKSSGEAAKLLSSAALIRTWWAEILDSTQLPLLVYLPLAIGLLPLLVLAVRALSVLRFGSEHWRYDLGIFWSALNLHPVESAEWGSFWIAFAGFAAIYVTYRKEFASRHRKRKEVMTAGAVGLFPISSEGQREPSDLEIYHAYKCRIPKENKDGHDRMPIGPVPVFFLRPPEPDVSFRALVQQSSDSDDDEIPTEAMKLGFDWTAFRHAKDEQRRQLSAAGFGIETGIRCNEDPTFSEHCLWIRGVKKEYLDVVAREQSVRCFSPGVLPDMRRLFEGEAWDTGLLDLMDCRSAARRYSMCISVTGLLLTNDGYFILQRRSSRVSTGTGNLNASVAGAADYRRDMCENRRDAWDLRCTVTRELKEEIGVLEGDLEFPPNGPFIGAAFNLRYGRDLNLYAFAHLTKSATPFSTARIARIVESSRNSPKIWNQLKPRTVLRDKWESDRLEFLDKKLVTVDSVTNGQLYRTMKSPSRHLMGALYSWAKFNEGK